MLRKISILLVAFLPWMLKRQILVSVFGYKLDPTARIGLSFVDARVVDLGPGARIGSLSIVRNLSKLTMGKNAKLGSFNWIFGMVGSNEKYFGEERSRQSCLTIDDHAAVTSSHLIDCIDSITIGAFTTLAGFRSQLLTHSIDVRRNRQSCAPIRIGSYCFIGTGVIVLKGANVPDFSIIAAGSVVAESLPGSMALYGGNPARKIKDLGPEVLYFTRKFGSVD